MNKKIKIATFGTFDILHAGHFNLINNCNELGDVYVGIVPDLDVKEYKNKYPTFNEFERMNNIKLFNNVSHSSIIGRNREDRKKWLIDNGIEIVAMGGDHLNHSFLNELCDELNIQYVIFPRTKGVSTSLIKTKIYKSVD